MTTETRIKACSVVDMADGDMLRVETRPPIAIYRVGDDFYATEATCTHMTSCLTEGYLDGDVVECALHMAKFCVRTGKALSLPATVPLRTFPTVVVDGEVLVNMPDAPAPQGAQ